MFAYLYYRIYAIYKYKWRDSAPGVYALCILSLLQGFNLLSALFTVELLTIIDFGVKKIYYGLLIVALLVVNYYRFVISTKFVELEKRWGSEPPKIKKIRGVLVLIYIFISVILILFLADYLSHIL